MTRGTDLLPVRYFGVIATLRVAVRQFELEREQFISILAIYHDNCMWVGDFYQYSPPIHYEYKTVN